MVTEPRSLEELVEKVLEHLRQTGVPRKGLTCDVFRAYAEQAVREALEAACAVIEGHITELRTFKLARTTYVPAIVRELEIVSEKLKALEGEARGQG